MYVVYYNCYYHKYLEKYAPKWINTDHYETSTSRKPRKLSSKIDNSTSTLCSLSEKMSQSLHLSSKEDKSELEETRIDLIKTL